MVKNLKAFFGNATLVPVTPKTIVAYKNKRYADAVKPARINRELALLKKAFNLAYREWEWAQGNPVCRISLEKEQNAGDRWLTEDEETRLFAVAAPWVRELVIFVIHTDMRRGEILALTSAGVNFTRRTVTVFQSKNGERRTIPVNQTVLDLFAQKRAQRSGTTRIL